MSSKNGDERLLRREAYLRWLNWKQEDVDERLRRHDLVLRWVEEGRNLWRVEPDGSTIYGLRECLLGLLDTICHVEDTAVRELAGETAHEAMAAAKEAFVAARADLPSKRCECRRCAAAGGASAGGAHDEGA